MVLFRFLSYVTPTWYFQLRPTHDPGYFLSERAVQTLQEKYPRDSGYESATAQHHDVCWRAFQSGNIPHNYDVSYDAWNVKTIPISDEYRFIRKYFNPLWSWFILCFRVSTLHNPIKELNGFLKSRRIKRYSVERFHYQVYETFVSKLVNDNPLISVIIPTLNRYTYLKDVLHDLAQQSYKNFEVLIIDQSVPYDEGFYSGWKLNLRFWYQEEKALWKARNDAVRASKGSFILLFDDDSRVDPDWIAQHLKCLDFFDADISAGVSLSVIGAKIPYHYSFFRWSDQLDTGNALVKRKVFEEIGLFDRQFEKQRMGDGEFGLRAYLHGFKNISNPYAKRVHLKVSEGGLREMGSWDAWRPKKFLSPRPIPSVLYFYRKYFGNNITRYSLLINIPAGLVPYRWKGRFLYVILFLPILILISPLWLTQVLLSWNKASSKLKEPKIEAFTI
jgi:glycosyltransferase involved in cell wall biosynthesis